MDLRAWIVARSNLGCALTMLGPSFRMLTDRLENEIIPSLMEGAEILSFKFGYAKI